MSAFIALAERADPRSPSYDEPGAARAVAAALGELRRTPEAVALARIARVARREVAALDRPASDSPCRAAFDICIDAFALARDELDNLIHLACTDRDLDRSALPSVGEVVDRLGADAVPTAPNSAWKSIPAQDRLVSSPIHCSEGL